MGNEHSHKHELKKEKTTVFKSKENEVYRIPALVYDRSKDVLLAFAEKRQTENDASAVALVMKKGTVNRDDQKVEVITWDNQVEVVKKADLNNYRPMNPCPVYEKNSKTIFLFFICVEGEISEQCQIKYHMNKTRLCYIKSTDTGKTWSNVIDLTDETELKEIKSWATFAVGPGHGIQTHEGRLIVPVYAYHSCCCACPCSCSCPCPCCCPCLFSITCSCSTPNALSLYSKDYGEKWHFGKMLETKTLECEMAEIFDENNESFIYCNARTEGGCRVEAVSKNDGHVFSHKFANKLVETGKGCQGSVVSFPVQSNSQDHDQNPKWLLFSHPSDKSKRKKLGVYLNESPQNTEAWSKPWIINTGPSGYSDLVYLDGGWFACLLECGEQKETEQIASVVFSYSEVKQCIPE